METQLELLNQVNSLRNTTPNKQKLNEIQIVIRKLLRVEASDEEKYGKLGFELSTKLSKEIAAKTEAKKGLFFWTLIYSAGPRMYCRSTGKGILAQSLLFSFFLIPNFYYFFKKIKRFNGNAELIILSETTKSLDFEPKIKSDLLSAYDNYLKEDSLFLKDGKVFIYFSVSSLF